VSHLKLRTQNNCLNCAEDTYGRYCHVCGQENIEPKESFWHLITHFVHDITHFDGKFFSTTKYLFTKPGFLSAEYIKGRRAAYLNPIRMYVFISAVFFLVFFTKYNVEESFKKGEKTKSVAQIEENLNNNKVTLQENIAATQQASPGAAAIMKAQLNDLNADIDLIKKDSAKAKIINERNAFVNYKDKVYRNKKEYDSIQAALPQQLRDNFIDRAIIKRSFEIKEKYGNENKAMKYIIEKYLHKFPQVFFISLPLLALVLQLLYVRRKDFFYVNHLIYTVHLYCAMFLFMLVLIGLNETANLPHFSWVGWVSAILFMYTFYYSYKSMRIFYKQSRRKTFAKFMLFNFAGLMVTGILFTVFFIVSVFIS
jgi:hypothetical protein